MRWLLLHFGVSSLALAALLVAVDSPGWASLLACVIGALFLSFYDSAVPK